MRTGVGDDPLALGLLAICAATALSLADMALLYSPDGGYGFASYPPLADLPRWRLLPGHYLGILLLPAYIPGYWLVFRGLREAGVARASFNLAHLVFFCLITAALRKRPPG